MTPGPFGGRAFLLSAITGKIRLSHCIVYIITLASTTESWFRSAMSRDAPCMSPDEEFRAATWATVPDVGVEQADCGREGVSNAKADPTRRRRL